MDIKLALSFITLLLLTTTTSAATLTEQCNDSFTKVAACLDFATGTATKPAKDCCTSVEQIKESNPVCLCYIIQQTHNGSANTKSVGLQEGRLLQLPSACRLANASLAYCPKLLNIPPTSPDYTIFTNTTTSSAPSTGTVGSTSPTTKDSSATFKTAPNLVGLITISIAVSILFSVPSH